VNEKIVAFQEALDSFCASRRFRGAMGTGDGDWHACPQFFRAGSEEVRALQRSSAALQTEMPITIRREKVSRREKEGKGVRYLFVPFTAGDENGT
jgi:hypothetical protein